MLKKLQLNGALRSAALVTIGWITFVGSAFVEGAITNLILQIIARVLPSVRDFFMLFRSFLERMIILPSNPKSKSPF